jgi:hypothetical protein
MNITGAGSTRACFPAPQLQQDPVEKALGTAAALVPAP